MNFLSSALLVIVILLIGIIVGFVVFRTISSPGKPQTEKEAPKKRQRALTKTPEKKPERVDHGAHVASKHGKTRSPEWSRVEKEHLLREPACMACGHKGEGLQVHHIKPFHLHPQLELDPDNLITLCEVKGRDHHLLLGHLDEWESYNEHVKADVKNFHNKTANQIRTDATWQKKVAQRP